MQVEVWGGSLPVGVRFDSATKILTVEENVAQGTEINLDIISDNIVYINLFNKHNVTFINPKNSVNTLAIGINFLSSDSNRTFNLSSISNTINLLNLNNSKKITFTKLNNTINILNIRGSFLSLESQILLDLNTISDTINQIYLYNDNNVILYYNLDESEFSKIVKYGTNYTYYKGRPQPSLAQTILSSISSSNNSSKKSKKKPKKSSKKKPKKSSKKKSKKPKTPSNK